jgi:hypothetical protein
VRSIYSVRVCEWRRKAAFPEIGVDWGQFQLSGSTVFKLTIGTVVDIRVFHDCATDIVIEPDGAAFFNGASFF